MPKSHSDVSPFPSFKKKASLPLQFQIANRLSLRDELWLVRWSLAGWWFGTWVYSYHHYSIIMCYMIIYNQIHTTYTGWWWLEHDFYFPIYWECHHPNWRTHIFQRGRYTTNQAMWWLYRTGIDMDRLAVKFSPRTTMISESNRKKPLV